RNTSRAPARSASETRAHGPRSVIRPIARGSRLRIPHIFELHSFVARDQRGAMRAIGEEFAGAEFGDPRRERRLIKFAERMAEKPSASFPSALNVAELEGAYRFFSNPRIQPDKILAPHVERTRMRMGDDAVTLAVHDTSTLSFREEGKRSGFGSLTGKSQQLWT